MGPGWTDSGGGWLVWIVVAVTVLVLVALVTLRAVWPDFGGDDPDVRDQAIERLRHRYARGEIDEEEFERRKAYLNDMDTIGASEELPFQSSRSGRDTREHG